MIEFKQGDRVIYNDSVYIIIVKCGDRYKLHPLSTAYSKTPYDKDKQQIFVYSTGTKPSGSRVGLDYITWIHIDLISLDYQYYRNEKISKILE